MKLFYLPEVQSFCTLMPPNFDHLAQIVGCVKAWRCDYKEGVWHLFGLCFLNALVVWILFNPKTPTSAYGRDVCCGARADEALFDEGGSGANRVGVDCFPSHH